MKPRSGSEVLLSKATQNEDVLDAALGGARISDEIFGFHAQQAVEKLLKARLVSLGVDYPKVHNLLTMVELLASAGVSLRENLASLCRLPLSAFGYGLHQTPPSCTNTTMRVDHGTGSLCQSSAAGTFYSARSTLYTVFSSFGAVSCE